MSPRQLQPARIHASLRRLRELLTDLEELVGTPSGEDLRADRARRHIAERILTQLVETAVSINSHIAAAELDRAPTDYRESFDLAAAAGALPAELARELRNAAGLRNVLVHDYLEVDLDLVAAAVPPAQRGFAQHVQAVAAYLRSRTP